MKLFGMKLQELRDEKGLKAGYVADMIGITGSTLSRYENDRRDPTLSMIKRFADYYEVDWHELLADVD